MLSLNEIIDFCTLTEGEVRAIAEHERLRDLRRLTRAKL
jgi:hypothetical protein